MTIHTPPTPMKLSAVLPRQRQPWTVSGNSAGPASGANPNIDVVSGPFFSSGRSRYHGREVHDGEQIRRSGTHGDSATRRHSCSYAERRLWASMIGQPGQTRSEDH